MAQSQLDLAIAGLVRDLNLKFQPAEFIPGCVVKDVTDINEYATENGWIECLCGKHNQQRVRYKGFPAGVEVDDELDVVYYPSHKFFEVHGVGGATATSADKTKVTKIYESDLGGVALSAAANGDLTAVGSVYIPSDLAHVGDLDTRLLFSGNQIELDVGGVTMLRLTNTTQNNIAFGDTSGVDDVDISFNDGTVTLDGATGLLTTGNIDVDVGSDIGLQGSAAPQSQTRRDILDRLGHLLDGGHPLNTYPASPHSQDAEFNNATQGDNNTIGTHAGGDFWEWSSGQPSSGNGSEDINTTRDSHLFVRTHRLDSDAVLQANITSIPASTFVTYECCVRFIYPFSTSSDEYFAIRFTDASSTNYFEVFWRNDATGPAMEAGTAYIDGGARTVESAKVTFADQPGPEAVWIEWQQQANDKYRARFSLDGFNFFNLKAGAYTFVNTYVPDQLELIFGIPDTASINIIDYYIDSFRRTN